MSISVKRPLNSLYVHVPFCKDKCNYCSFISFVDKNNAKQVYVNALLREISTVLAWHGAINLNSIYIGGGTPSLLTQEQVKSIIQCILKYCSISDLTEITIEVNPGTVNLNYLSGLREIGINRLSIGIQSFDDEVLKQINRIHSSEVALGTVKMAQEVGFNNISIDLINGLPDQTLESWITTLNYAMKLDIQHISTYGLKIEEGTVFGNNPPENLPEEEICAQMYLKTAEILECKGLNQYEISNYSKNGYESKHNRAYWKNEEYFGFGLGAHGYVEGERYSNTCNFEKYLENPLKKENVHKVTYREAYEEAIFLGLRLRNGINLKSFEQKYGFNILNKFKSTIKKHTENSFLEINGDCLSLTQEGVLLSNLVLADFLEDISE